MELSSWAFLLSVGFYFILDFKLFILNCII